MKKSTIVSIIFFVLAISIVILEVFQSIQTGGGSWIGAEMYFSVLLNILFLTIISFFLDKYLNSEDKILSYSMSVAIVASLAFYFYASLSYDPAFPTLAVLHLISIFCLTPGLLLTRGSIALIGKMRSRRG